MRTVTYSMVVSLDGFAAGPNGEMDWIPIDEEIHAYFNELDRHVDMHLYGRVMYQDMAAFWPAADDPANPWYIREYSRQWTAVPKTVFSRTLDSVEWNARLVREDPAAEVARLKAEPGGEMGVAGISIANALIREGLVDTFLVFVAPVLLGAGRPMFEDGIPREDLRLVETKTFGSGVVMLHYHRGDDTE